MNSPAPTPDPGRRERKRQQTLDHLAATAFALFEAEGYEAVTMEQIAAAADLAKGTLYNHFPVKEALLAHRFHGELAQALDGLMVRLAEPEPFARRLSQWLRTSAEWCERRRSYMWPYVRYRFLASEAAARRRDGDGRSGLERLFRLLILAGQASGELRRDLPAGQLADLLQHLYLGALMRWLATPGEGAPAPTLEEEFAAIVELFVHGAAARAGAAP
ncbi:TetR/AcrR family transcriptional regulator [Lysobacter sp. BMK333-48F3]|uniref:TetR/AcrR family transcriptional regulator n=1 Tax=Lysobacter sp. BMK333-48F3 TaxID=2867962 RepID=UPI001C8C15F0|nr:TetR/AcrR family transcriptional regulator [Lysobacter sp. BMK333-48F3]MBX9403972.1 TetR/AcrR family transcriptional regulator [Lysobacter sp. BMK333-48F3]